MYTGKSPDFTVERNYTIVIDTHTQELFVKQVCVWFAKEEFDVTNLMYKFLGNFFGQILRTILLDKFLGQIFRTIFIVVE